MPAVQTPNDILAAILIPARQRYLWKESGWRNWDFISGTQSRYSMRTTASALLPPWYVKNRHSTKQSRIDEKEDITFRTESSLLISHFKHPALFTFSRSKILQKQKNIQMRSPGNLPRLLSVSICIPDNGLPSSSFCHGNSYTVPASWTHPRTILPFHGAE